MLQPVSPTPSVLANMHASRDVQQVAQLAQAIAKKRAEGIPAAAAQPERVAPNGQVIPARPGMPAVTAAEYRASLGESNNALFESLSKSLLGE